MEVASGDYNVDLEKTCNTMMRFKTEPSANGNFEDNVPTIPALPSPMGKNIVTPIFFSMMYIFCKNKSLRCKPSIHYYNILPLSARQHALLLKNLI